MPYNRSYRHRFHLLIASLLIAMSSFGQSKKSDLLFGQGVELYNAGRYVEAIPIFEEVIQLDEGNIALESARYGYGYDWLARCYYKLGDTIKAKEISPLNYLFEPIDRRLTIESDQEADIAAQLQKSNIKEAILHAKKCLELEHSELGECSLFSVGSYQTIAELYFQIGDNNNALTYYNDGLSVLDEHNIDNSIYNFNLLMGKVYVHLSNNDIQSAISEMKRLKAISDFEKNVNMNEYPSSLVDYLYAKISIQNQDYERATTYAVSAFKSLLAQYDTTKEEVFMSLTKCVHALIMISKYDVAIPLLQEAIELMANNRGHKGIMLSYLAECTRDINYCQDSLINLSGSIYIDEYNNAKCLIAGLYVGKGEVEKAGNLYKQVCDFYKNVNSESPIYGMALMHLGDMYEQCGDYEKAYNYYRQKLNLLSNNRKSPDYALTLMRLIPVYAKYLRETGEYYSENASLDGYKMGQELNDLFINIRIGDFLNAGIGLPTIADVMNSFFQELLQQQNPVSTIPLSAIESYLSQMIYEYLIPMNLNNDVIITGIINEAKRNLAYTRHLRDKHDAAIELMNEVVATCKRLNISYDNYLHDLAYIQYESGNKCEAYANFKIGYDFLKNKILAGYKWMTIDERDKLTRAFRGNLDNIPHYAAITPEDTRYAELGYNALLFTKGLLLNSSIELSRFIQEEGNKNAQDLLHQWRKANQEYQVSQQTQDNATIKMLKTRTDEIERKLIATSKSFGDYTDGLTVEYKEVQSHLKDGDIAIEFFSYLEDAKSRMYGALLLSRNESPKYFPVGSDREWGRYIENCYSNDRLFNSLFSELKPYLPKRSDGSIFFSADGLLHTIAIENIPGAQDYNFKRLSSTRELALCQKDSLLIKNMVIIGGVKYGIGKLADYYKGDGAGSRESPDFLSYLPGTRIEVDRIKSLFLKKMKISTLIGGKATETKFKNLSGKKIGLIHVATHGFYIQPTDIKNQSMLEAEVMKSTGLYLAGAQNTLWDEQEHGMKDDGILSASEVSMLDLRGLKLVVLSACKTGRGAINPDGVFGLQRGFKQAGAEGIMMSLWNVDDKATQVLMEEFYKNLLDGMEPYASLHEAQNAIRKKYQDPKYWAAFILIDAIKDLKL